MHRQMCVHTHAHTHTRVPSHNTHTPCELGVNKFEGSAASNAFGRQRDAKTEQVPTVTFEAPSNLRK